MSKWKDPSVTIIQAFSGFHYGDLFGLGDDTKIYLWDRLKGAWVKYWDGADEPERKA